MAAGKSSRANRTVPFPWNISDQDRSLIAEFRTLGRSLSGSFGRVLSNLRATRVSRLVSERPRFGRGSVGRPESDAVARCQGTMAGGGREGASRVGDRVRGRARYSVLADLSTRRRAPCRVLRSATVRSRCPRARLSHSLGPLAAGLCRRSGRAIIGHGFEVLRLRGLFAGHHPDNEGSMRLLHKLGFRFTHRQHYSPTGHEHLCYGLTNPDHETT